MKLINRYLYKREGSRKNDQIEHPLRAEILPYNVLSGGRTRSQAYVEEEPGEIIEESVETDEESEAEVTSYKNFCDIDDSNIIEGGRTRSQRALVACSELNRTILNYKLALLSHEKDDPNKKGYHSYKEAVQADPQWKEEYMKEIKKLETIG